MSEVTREMISAAHGVTMKNGIVLSWETLRDIYLSMDALANHKKTSGSPLRCIACGGALSVTGREDATGECVCAEPTAPGVIHRTDGPCYMAEAADWEEEARRYALNADFWRRKYEANTVSLQRKPLTDEEIDDLSRTMVKGDKSVNWLCRAIERAHGIGEKE